MPRRRSRADEVPNDDLSERLARAVAGGLRKSCGTYPSGDGCG